MSNETKLYYGDNGVHEFWESEDSEHLIIRSHGSDYWHSLTVNGEFRLFGKAKRPRTVANRIQRQLDMALELSNERIWRYRRSNAKAMTLIAA